MEVEEGIKRRRRAFESGEVFNTFDEKELAYHQRVREGYLELVRAKPNGVVIVDALRSIKEVSQDVLNIVLSFIYKM